jgi:septal ring factor EnvC (AmiA/AmiB activator)
MKWFFPFAGLLFLFVFLPLQGAEASEEMNRILREKKSVESNLKSLKKQLDDYQLKLKNTTSQETQSLEALKNIKKQIFVLEQLIGESQTYLNSINREIGHLSNELDITRQTYGRVSADFQRIAVAAYKYGDGRRDAELLFASGSLHEAVARSRYIGLVTKSVHNRVTDLQSTAQKLQTAQAALQRTYREKESAIRDQQVQLQAYASRRKEKEVVLSTIKKNKKEYAAKISVVQKKQRQLQSKIESLIIAEQEVIEKERQRARLRELAIQREKQRRILEAKKLEAQRLEKERLRLEALKKKPATDGSASPAGKEPVKKEPLKQEPPKKEPVVQEERDAPVTMVPDVTAIEIEKVSADFDRSFGRLPWPVRNGVVVRRFGTVQDKDLKIVTTSNGIDISVPLNSPVRAVSGGKVAQIAYLPTFGNIVIIRHPNSYLTVYANLARVSVAKGEVIQSQHLLGSSGAMTEGGSIVHFEVWKGKAKQNPEKWLRK